MLGHDQSSATWLTQVVQRLLRDPALQWKCRRLTVWSACLEAEAVVVQKPDSSEVNSAASGGVATATRVTPTSDWKRRPLESNSFMGLTSHSGKAIRSKDTRRTRGQPCGLVAPTSLGMRVRTGGA